MVIGSAHRRPLAGLVGGAGRVAGAAAIVALLMGACSTTSGSDVPWPVGAGGNRLARGGQRVQCAPASFDLSVGDDRRFLAGVFTPDKGLVIGGIDRAQSDPKSASREGKRW